MWIVPSVHSTIDILTSDLREVAQQMCLLLREAMNVGRIAISDFFFSIELELREALLKCDRAS